AEEVRELRAKGGQRVAVSEGGQTRTGGVLVARDEGGRPECHRGIADVLLEDAAVGADLLGDHGEVAVEQLDHGRGCQLLAHRGETFQVGEHDGGYTTLGLLEILLRRVDEPRDDARVDVLAEGVLDPLLRAQLPAPEFGGPRPVSGPPPGWRGGGAGGVSPPRWPGPPRSGAGARAPGVGR